MPTIHTAPDHMQIAIPVEQMLSRIFSSLPIVGATENREMYVYKSVEEVKGLQMRHRQVVHLLDTIEP